jgi:hypothetical protein
MSDIDDMEAQMSAPNAPGETPVDLAEQQQRAQETETALDVALAGKPHDLQVRIMRVVSKRGLDDNDPSLDLFAAAGIAADAAASVEVAAKEVTAGVGKIQGQIFTGAIKAGESIRKDVVAGIDAKMTEGGQAIVAAIGIAAKAGSAAIADGSKDLIEKLDKAVEVKKKEGVSEFALAAAEAAVAAAGAASAAVRSEARVKLRYSALFMALIFIGYAGLGWAANYEYLSLSNQIAPAPLVLNAQGKVNCGLINGKGGKERVCEIR